MTLETTYTQARANFAQLCDEVIANRTAVIITRRGGANVALIAADELASLVETAHLLRSPRNAQRLLEALQEADAGSVKPQTVEQLQRELGFGEET
ncbi:type II toxin-antitoxin system Phd/YefM family antitoxin [Gloeobacter violaceus]|nr:type II toxin-antitoxin system prevent-host-death family antitoxin [Gloeobacter violaceus]